MEDSVILFLKAGLPDPQEAAEFLKVNRTTISRWRSGTVKMPHSVVLLLDMMAGNPPALAKQKWFDGWRFNGDLFISPEGEKFTEGDIRAIRTMQSEIIGLKSLIRRLESEIANLKKQNSVPDNVIRFPGRYRA